MVLSFSTCHRIVSPLKHPPTFLHDQGTLTGDFSNFTPTYNSSDPDCWWTYHQCTTPKTSGLEADVANVSEVCGMFYFLSFVLTTL